MLLYFYVDMRINSLISLKKHATASSGMEHPQTINLEYSLNSSILLDFQQFSLQMTVSRGHKISLSRHVNSRPHLSRSGWQVRVRSAVWRSATPGDRSRSGVTRTASCALSSGWQSGRSQSSVLLRDGGENLGRINKRNTWFTFSGSGTSRAINIFFQRARLLCKS